MPLLWGVGLGIWPLCAWLRKVRCWQETLGTRPSRLVRLDEHVYGPNTATMSHAKAAYGCSSDFDMT